MSYWTLVQDWAGRTGAVYEAASRSGEDCLALGEKTETAGGFVTPPQSKRSYWRTGHGRRYGYGLYRGPKRRVGMWAHVRLGEWWGIEVRYDPDVMGSKLMVTLAGFDIGWLE